MPFIPVHGADGGDICHYFTLVGDRSMSIGILFKIAAVGILVTLLNQVLKHSGKEEHAYLVSLCGFIIVLTWVLPFIVELFENMESLFSM